MGTSRKEFAATAASTFTGALTSALMIVAAADVWAQGGPQRPRSQPSTPSRQVDIDRTRDRARDLTQDKDRDQDRDRLHDRDRIYASDLMTSQERAEYQSKLRSLTTEQERVEFRLQHQQEMQARAQAQGKKLAAAPTREQLEQQERSRQGEQR